MQIQDVDPSLTGLLQIAAMLLLPATLGLSVTRSLRVAPSHFLNRSLETYFPALIGFDLLWLGGAALWLAFGASPVAELDAVVDGRNLRLAVAILLGLVSVGQVWLHTGVTPRLRAISRSMDPLGSLRVAEIDASGNFQAELQDVDPRATLGQAGIASAFYAALTALVAALLILIMAVSGAFTHWTILLDQILRVGLWMSLGVIGVDLFMDVWPGTATPTRLRRAYLYYVRIFEYSRNIAVLIAFATVLLLAPVAYFLGVAPLAVVSFPVWIASCIVFATWWNRRLYPSGRVTSTLPLPVSRNVYSGQNPRWAYFFTSIHVVMVVSLVAEIMSLG